jgi:hypothetical protein
VRATSSNGYLLVAPLLPAALGWIAYWWVVRDDRKQSRMP